MQFMARPRRRLIFAPWVSSAIVADERTYAERFGSKASGRALILHVGDVGIADDSDADRSSVDDGVRANAYGLLHGSAFSLGRIS